jgi:hypothetical protein
LGDRPRDPWMHRALILRLKSDASDAQHHSYNQSSYEFHL